MPLLRWLARNARLLARTGCVSIGTVYVLVGTFALVALSGRFIENADEDRIVHVLMGVPGGPLAIWLIVGGIVGYIFWRAIEALVDPYGFGSGWMGISRRVGVALTAAAYGLIAFSAARIALGGRVANGGQAAEQEQQRLVADVLAWPGGELLVGGAGVFVIAVALAQFVLVWKRTYATEIRMHARTPAGRKVIHFLAWYGYAARGVILGVLGYFLVRGAVTRDPKAVGDTDTAFDFVGGGLIGDSAFAIIAVGTIAYGVFMYVNAWYYRFEAHDIQPRRVAEK